ncbi:hypothetical protein HMPREF1981_00981 [Bacteroides pyogenes F0041]|uniref:Uncharacterized protein n=1 Tax=Bacteroides pyogenes F0041 TaxID=1321819 RepID=U2DXB1_9BACE|nr:hypothetical protein HMPREF1981_00981 [Bacteroides pyogenes F0041]
MGYDRQTNNFYYKKSKLLQCEEQCVILNGSISHLHKRFYSANLKKNHC